MDFFKVKPPLLKQGASPVHRSMPWGGFHRAKLQQISAKSTEIIKKQGSYAMYRPILINQSPIYLEVSLMHPLLTSVKRFLGRGPEKVRAFTARMGRNKNGSPGSAVGLIRTAGGA